MSENTNKSNLPEKTKKGISKVVPLLLVAVAAFIGFSFITQGTGHLGSAIATVLLGLFSVGAYLIPFLLLLHAILYKSDAKKRKFLPRVIFSTVTLITFSALLHTFANLGEEAFFSASTFYSDGVNASGGGFIGGVFSFALTKILGSIGLIIIAILVFSTYAVYFFAGKDTSVGQRLSGVLKKTVGCFAGLKGKADTKKAERAAKREERRLDELSEKQAELYDDEFFAVDNGMKELSISELGMGEVRDDKDLEINPNLQGSVHHKSEVPSDEPPKERRKTSFDYSSSQEKKAVSSNDIIYVAAPDIASTVSTSTHHTSPTANADDVFTSDFVSFDVKLSSELAAKPSSIGAAMKATSEIEVEEIARPISTISPEDIEMARRRADFEMKKKAALDAREKYEKEKEAFFADKPEDFEFEFGAENRPENEEFTATNDIISFESSKSESSQDSDYVFETYASSKNNEYEPDLDRNETPVTSEEPFSNAVFSEKEESYEAVSPYQKSQEADVGIGVEEILVSNPNNESADVEIASADESEENKYKRVAAFANTTGTYSAEAPKEQNEFKPYAPPKTEDLPRVEDAPTQQSAVYFEDSLSIAHTYAASERTDEPARHSNYSVESDSPDTNFYEVRPEPEAEDRNSQSFDFDSATSESISDARTAAILEGMSSEEEAKTGSFDFSDDEDEEDLSDLTTEQPDEDIQSFYEEIPEEEQNEQVKEYRKMFSFLDEDEASDSVSSDDEAIPGESYSDEDYDEGKDALSEFEYSENPIGEDEPPFLAPTKIQKPEQKKAAEPKKTEKPDYSNYKLPPIDLLKPGKNEEDPLQNEECNQNAEKLIDTLEQFGVRASIKGFSRGPRITRYEIVPARGVKVNTITNLFDDIALNMAAEGIRMEAPIPGKAAIGVEIPNKKPSLVLLREIVESEEFTYAESKTAACIGKDVTGNPVIGDIAKMPHVLIAGATGMGKSVCINAVLLSILYKARPDEVKLIMIDPKKVEFNGYDGIPHLLIPVVTDVKQAAGALMWAVEQMEKRYDIMKQFDVRKLDSYNEKVMEDPSLGDPLPKIIIVIDELSDIMLQARKPVEDLIMSIAQKARAAGIHLIIGTQRPSVDVITGVIKANIPSRISCKVASFTDSKTIIEQAGAEKLLNNGDMLYVPAGAPKALRVQGAFVSDSEVSAVMKYLKSQVKGNVYDEQALEDINRAAQKCIKGGKGGSSDDFGDDDDDNDNEGFFNDHQFLEAVELATKQGKISTSLLQRKIGIGYGKAAKYIDIMEEQGIVSEPNGQKPREVLITRDEWHEILSRRSVD